MLPVNSDAVLALRADLLRSSWRGLDRRRSARYASHRPDTPASSARFPMVPFRNGSASSSLAITFLSAILVVLSSCDKPETPPRAVPEDEDLSHREAKDVSPGRTGPRPAPA